MNASLPVIPFRIPSLVGEWSRPFGRAWVPVMVTGGLAIMLCSPISEAWAQAATAGGGAAVATAPAPSAATPSRTLRPAAQAALQSAQALLAAGKATDAQQVLRDLEQKVLDRNPDETYLLERLKAAAAAILGDAAAAARSSEAALNTARATVEERRTLLAQLTGYAQQLKDHESTMRWAQAHREAGGREEGVTAAQARAALAMGQCRAALEPLETLIAAAEQRGQRPPEPQLRAAAACQSQLGQEEGYERELRRLVTHHPSPAYWGDLIARLQRRPGFADRLLLDSFRLMRHVAAMQDADDFLSAAQLALRAALPGEARATLQAGFDAGALGKGPGAAAHRELLARAQREADADRAQLDSAHRQASAAADGRALVLLGQAAWTYGDAVRARQWMEQGLAKGVARQVHDARLHLALVLVAAGEVAEARRLLSALSALSAQPADDGLSELARLWLIAIR